MNSLFSVFDPSVTGMSSSVFSLNWLSMILIIFLMPSLYWMLKSPFSLMTSSLARTLSSEISMNFGILPTPGMTHFVVSMFFFIALNNYLGLLPYVFTASSHLSFTLSIALTSWISYTIWAMSKNLGHILAHFVPLGTPYLLMPLMVLIELVSSLIRPITLSVRLAANMVAGHLLLTLISSPACHLSFWFLQLILMSILLMMILENAVAMIQAYVFSMLSSLYLSEVNSSNL